MASVIDTTTIEKFMVRMRLAAQSKAKDIRITPNEALELVAAMGQVLARLSALEAERGMPELIQIRMDGGDFVG
jgi:hypothetical protein